MNDNVSRHLEQLEAYNRRDIDGLLRDVAVDAVFTDHALGQTFTGREEIRGWVLAQLGGFPDDRVEVHDAFGAGDWTVVRYSSRGTHTGAWAGLEATHRIAETSICDVVRWADGKVVEDHVYYDLYGGLAQLGFAPPLNALA